MKTMKKLIAIVSALIIIACGLAGLLRDKIGISDPIDTTSVSTGITDSTTEENDIPTSITSSTTDSVIPEYNGKAYVTLNDNMPQFENFDDTTVFETYSELDYLDRCGVAYANICKELMPTDDREEIGSVKPSGWVCNGKSNNNKYDFVDGKYIYNRCHLIGFQLAGENANEKNLITGTRYLNIEGMLPFENMVADYVKEEGGHVLYRVTPIFKDNELVCRGVQIEAYSVEDDGKDICFNVFCFNVQPGVEINYQTGQNWTSSTASATTLSTSKQASSVRFVVNESSKKFHIPECSAVQKISAENKLVLVAGRDELINKGYSPCKICNP